MNPTEQFGEKAKNTTENNSKDLSHPTLLCISENEKGSNQEKQELSNRLL